MPNEDDFITVEGAARLAGVAPGTIRRWLADPDVPVTKYTTGSGRVWIDRNQVIAYRAPRPVLR